MENNDNENKTVLNIGWENMTGAVMDRFSAFAEKGYILAEMNDKLMTFKKDDPQDLEFLLYNGKTEDTEYIKLTENGYRLLCSCGEHHMLAASRENAEKYKNASRKKKYILEMIVSALLLGAVILAIPNSGGVVSSLRSVFTAVFSCTFVFAAVRFFRKNDDNSKDE